MRAPGAKAVRIGVWAPLGRLPIDARRRIRGRFEREYGSLMNESGVRSLAMANGTVDFFNDTGGYGFIETEDADEDVFFHMEDVGGEDLTEGTELEFEIEQAPKGPRATNVVRV